jgi:hypothetical protein
MSNNPDPNQPVVNAVSADVAEAVGDTTTSHLVAPSVRYILAGLGIMAGLILACLLLAYFLGRTANVGGGSATGPAAQGNKPSVQAQGNVVAGQPFVAQGSGFAGGEPVEIFAATNPNAPSSSYISLGTVNADANGGFNKEGLVLPPDRVAGASQIFFIGRGANTGFTQPIGAPLAAAAPLPPAANTPTPTQAASVPTVTATITPTAGTPPPNTNLPDLIISKMNIELQPGVDCAQSQQLGLRIEMRNVGIIASGPFVINVNGADSTVQNGLQPNESLQVWVPGYAAQNRVTVDSTNVVSELNENNNAVALALPVPTLPPNCRPTPTPTSTLDPNAGGVWFGKYYANVDLEEPAVLQRADATLNFDWKTGSPGPGVPVDNFSAEWTRKENFPSTDSYEFTITLDDGARVYIDNTKVFDEWFNGGKRTKTFNASISKGEHTIRVQYYEATGGAAIALSWKVKYAGWVGKYYNSTDFSGPIAHKSDDADINFDWGLGSPAPTINADNFSVDWQRTINLPAGTYLFAAEIDDGMRVFVDNQLVIDALVPGNKVVTATRLLGAGNHTFQVQYVEFGGFAKAKLRIEPVVLPPPTPTSTTPPTLTPTATGTAPPTLTPTITYTPEPTATPTTTPTPTETTTSAPATDTPTATATTNASPVVVTTP